ncbi:hypothetical protein MMC29_003527 [Sticta canariensis]|nr:hypothetical protein [Sticta canariensis]
MPALEELFNPEEAEVFVELSNGVDCFEDSVAEAVEVDASLTDDPVEIGELETVALDDENVLDDKAVLDIMLYPASA